MSAFNPEFGRRRIKVIEFNLEGMFCAPA